VFLLEPQGRELLSVPSTFVPPLGGPCERIAVLEAALEGTMSNDMEGPGHYHRVFVDAGARVSRLALCVARE